MYLIDGHNLIGTGLLGFTLSDDNDEMMLVNLLKSFAARSGKRVTVIFDHGLPGGKSDASNHAVSVIFASQPGIADTVMIREINRTRSTSQWIVVSDDQQVRQAAQGRKLQQMRCQEFARLLNPPTASSASTRKGKKTSDAEDDPGSAIHPAQSAKDVEEFMRAFEKKKPHSR
jgi:predicted RNA-binding protein with PIN domain